MLCCTLHHCPIFPGLHGMVIHYVSNSMRYWGICKLVHFFPIILQACRIPETKCTEDHLKAGEGFDPGDSKDNEKGGQDQGTTRDQTDFGGSRWETEIGIC